MWNESKGGTESGGLKHQLSQVEGDLNYKRCLNWVPFQKITPNNKVVVVWLKNVLAIFWCEQGLSKSMDEETT